MPASRSHRRAAAPQKRHAKVGVGATAAQGLRADAEPPQLVLRQVDAPVRPLAEIDADILPVIDELQGRTDRVGTAQVLRRGGAEQMQQQPPDRVGRAAAVVQQFGVVGVAVLDRVLREGGEQVAEGLQRQPVRRDDRAQAQEDRIAGRRAAFDAVELLPISGESAQTFFGRKLALVGDVVGRAGEGIDRRDGRPQRSRQQARADGEILVVIDGHGASIGRRER